MKKETNLKFSLSDSEIENIKLKEELDTYINNELSKKKLELIKEKNEELNIDYYSLSDSQQKKQSLENLYKESKGRLYFSLFAIGYFTMIFLLPIIVDLGKYIPDTTDLKYITNIIQVISFFSTLLFLYAFFRNKEIKNNIEESFDKFKQYEKK